MAPRNPTEAPSPAAAGIAAPPTARHRYAYGLSDAGNQSVTE